MGNAILNTFHRIMVILVFSCAAFVFVSHYASQSSKSTLKTKQTSTSIFFKNQQDITTNNYDK